MQSLTVGDKVQYSETSTGTVLATHRHLSGLRTGEILVRDDATGRTERATWIVKHLDLPRRK